MNLGEIMDKMPKEFLDYIVQNYPGRTVISDPKWHAPRIWRAACHALESALAQEGEAVATGLHAAIMNLPATSPDAEDFDRYEHRAFKIGHKVARHAAAELVLTARPVAPVAGEWKWVPVKMTPEMARAAWEKMPRSVGYSGRRAWADEAYTAMLASAPAPDGGTK